LRPAVLVSDFDVIDFAVDQDCERPVAHFDLDFQAPVRRDLPPCAGGIR